MQIEKKCKICLSLFIGTVKNQTCSSKCGYHLRSLTLKKYYENESVNKKTSRNKNIGIGNTVKLSENEINNIKEVLSRGYVNDKRIIMTLAKVPYSYRVLNRILKENSELSKLHNSTYCKFIPHKIQLLPLEKFKELVEDFKTLSYSSICKKWGIGYKPLYKICKHFYNGVKPDILEIIKIKNKKLILEKENFRRFQGSKNETWIEKIVRSILLSFNIDFDNEKYLVNKKYRYDFLIKNTNKIIEVNGDYWHGYGKKYEELDQRQKIMIDNYNKKMKYYKENNFQLLEIWENEIESNLNSVVNKIKKYAEI